MKGEITITLEKNGENETITSNVRSYDKIGSHEAFTITEGNSIYRVFLADRGSHVAYKTESADRVVPLARYKATIED